MNSKDKIKILVISEIKRKNKLSTAYVKGDRKR